MRPFRLVVLAVVSVVGLLAAVGAIAYAADYAVEATVREKSCRTSAFQSPGGNSVTVQTKLFGIRYTLTGVPDHECSLINAGNYVQYHLRTGRTSLWTSEGGTCIYDSVAGIGGC